MKIQTDTKEAMKKFDGILICTDLDGTLLRSDKTISRQNKDAISYFMENGGLFTFVTGRMPYVASSFYDEIRPNAPIGCVNGGALFDFSTDKYVWQRELDTRALEIVELVAEKTDVGIQVNTFEHIYCCRENEGMREFFRRVNTQKLEKHWRDVEKPIAKVLFTETDGEKMERLIALLSSLPQASEFDFVRSERTLYEILPKGISKGVSVEKLCEYCGISRERTVAVGDYDNDVEMLKTAGLGIAVENASDGAKAASDVITVSNEDHAIAKIIHDLDSGILKI